MTLTTPPIAEEPNSKAAGPRSTSMRSAVIGLIEIAWSGPGRGQVERADAVGQDADAVARQAAKHRRGGGRAEAGRRHARLPGKRLADAGPDFAVELGLVEHRHAAEHVLRACV